MTTSQEIAERILSIPDSRYEAPDEDFTDLEVALSDTDFEGVAIRAPAVVDAALQPELPLLVARKHTGLRGWEVPSAQNSVVIATDMTRRRIYIANLHPMPPGKTAAGHVASPAKPSGASAIAEISGVERVDARALLSLPREPASYRFTAVLFDWRSNTVETRVSVAGAAIPATASVSTEPVAAVTRRGLPSWLASASTPPVPPGRPPAAAFRIEPGNAPRLKAVGAFSVVADMALVLKSPYVMDEVGGARKSVVAHVPATVAIFPRNGTNPIRRDVTVPIYADRPVATGDPLTGYFSFDMQPDGQLALTPGDYAAYLIVEGNTFGPVSFTAPASGTSAGAP